MPSPPGLPLKLFSGLYSKGGTVRRLTFEAMSIEEAREIAKGWGIGVDREMARSEVSTASKDNDPGSVEALTYTVWETVSVLKLSRSTIYRLIAREVLRPLPGIRHKLIPRDQVARYASGQLWQSRN